MTIDKNNEGAWRISDIINDQLITKVYYFYTKNKPYNYLNNNMRCNNEE